MLLQSLKNKLLFTVAAMVIGSGLLGALLMNQRYSKIVFENMIAQAENLAHAVALEATEKALISDFVAVQNMLDRHLRSNGSIAYLFIVKEERVRANAFAKDIPAGLIKADGAAAGHLPRSKKIVSATGERYLDVSWPILDGKGGVLRLGFSEAPYRKKVTKLLLQISGLTFAILIFALTGALLFVRRIVNPLAALARATRKIDDGELEVRVEVKGQDEVGKMANSFNQMVERISDYTRRLEAQALELERAHIQARTFCEIVQEIGALPNLDEIGSFLIKRFQKILMCSHMVLFFHNGHRDHLYKLTVNGGEIVEEQDAITSALAVLEGASTVQFTNRTTLNPPLIPEHFLEAAKQVIVPVQHENQPFGALVIACPGGCDCNIQEVEAIGLILSQSAGVIKRALSQEEDAQGIQRRLEKSTEFSGIIGKDQKMQVIYKLIEDIAPTDATVLIQGESGTGKEMVARAIHERSPRKDNSFVVINCSAYPATLLESEIFGHEKGAFTGAIRQKAGRFEQADKGTVFLDEIGEISPSAQIKLLRVLQTRKFERIGGEQTLSVNVRILAATNKDLLQEVKNGHFREDLYYRLNVIPIHLPPLGERRNDIPLLARHFLRHFAAEQNKNIEDFRPEALKRILDHAWPGNVRELENSIEHAVVLAKRKVIETADLPASLQSATQVHRKRAHLSSIAENEKELLQQVLEECDWNKKRAAHQLGISRNTLYGKLKKYQLSRPTTH